MSDLILHHYELSPFSEKIRTVFGLKNIQWHSVEVEAMPPRPLLSGLTGGYRRIPVLQVGADIYCDTNTILPAIDRLYPSPSLYPAGSEGVAQGLGFAWERQMWIPTIGILVHFIGEHLPPEFIKDRKEGYLGIDISKDAMAPQFAAHVEFVRAQLGWLRDALLARPFLFGDEPSVADLACWQTLFLLRKNCPPEVENLLDLEVLTPWYERIVAYGHGKASAMTPQDAFEVARTSAPAPVTHVRPDADPGGIRAGTRVSVTPDDNARVAVSGILVAADTHEIIISDDSGDAGELHIHFPRLGFDVITG